MSARDGEDEPGEPESHGWSKELESFLATEAKRCAQRRGFQHRPVDDDPGHDRAYDPGRDRLDRNGNWPQ